MKHLVVEWVKVTLVCRMICRLLDLIDPDHCEKSIEEDKGKDEILKF